MSRPQDNSGEAQARRYTQVRRSNLSQTSKETRDALPSILHALSNIDATESAVYFLSQLPALDPAKCPGFTLNDPQQDTSITPNTGCRVRVIDDDTLDAAIALSILPPRVSTPPQTDPTTPPPRVAVLNLASDTTPGGGWLAGTLAQEESICYRSSLYLSLHKTYYPIPPESAVYTPSTVIIRTSWSKGHSLMTPATKPTDLPVVSMISVAALRRPKTKKLRSNVDPSHVIRIVFDSPSDRSLTKQKMRLSLRIAGSQGHTRLVLGALGCGAFRNPTEEVAICWREVLQEPEFAGGWWNEVVFAVLDKGSDGDNGARDHYGNFATFERVLNGLVV